jgi:hypothetical protein
MEQLSARMDKINLLTSSSTSDKTEVSTEVETPDSDFRQAAGERYAPATS